MLLPESKNDGMDKTEMRRWLENEYGFITSISSLPKFMDAIDNNIVTTFNGNQYNLMVLPKENMISYSVYGIMWDCADNFTCVSLVN